MTFNPFAKPEQLPEKPPDKPDKPPKPDKDKPNKVLKEIQIILKAAGNESNIPVAHDYWHLCNEYRRMTADKD